MQSNQQNNKFCNMRSFLMFIGFWYLTTMIYGIILLKNNQWTSNNYLIAIFIYCGLIIFDILFWFICIKFNLCPPRNQNNNNNNPWYQLLNISDILTILQNNFEVTEEVDLQNNESNNSEPNEIKTCLICNNEYTKNEDNNIKYIKLDCNHEFCEKCISKWCNLKNSCPLCRTNILTENHLNV